MRPETRLSMLAVSIAACLMLGAAGCGGSHANDQPQTPQTTSGSVARYPTNAAPQTASPQTASPPMGAAGETGATDHTPSGTSSTPVNGSTGSAADSTTTTVPPGDAALNDGQIAALTDEANNEEVEQGRYAAEHATDARVKRFAEKMVTAHRDMLLKMRVVLDKQNITLASSQQVAKLNMDARQAFDTWKAHTGTELDRAYIDAQVKAHTDVLDLFDNKLIPAAKNAALRDALQQVRPMVAEHLREALDIQKALGMR